MRLVRQAVVTQSVIKCMIKIILSEHFCPGYFNRKYLQNFNRNILLQDKF